MIAEHRRPLVAFILVALVCALVVGNAVRTSTLQRLVGGGLPLSVLVPIAPDVLLTINASGHNGLGGDLPYVGRAVVAVSNPAPPSVPAPVTTAVVTVSAASPTTAVQNTPAAAAPAAAAPAAAAPAAAATSTRTAGRHHAAPRRAVTTSGTPTVAPARGTPTLSPGGTKHVETAVDKRGPSPEKAVSHELKRAQHEAEKAAHHQALDQKHALKAETKHAGKPHHAKPHHPKPHHPKPHHVKPHHDKRH